MSRLLAKDDRAVPVIVAGALGVLVLSAVLFAFVGALRGSDATVVGGPATETTPIEEDGADAGDGGEAAADDGGGEASADGEEEASDTGGDAAAEEDGAEGDGQAEAADDGGTEATDDQAPSIDPAEVSVQVLDAVGDGGVTASAAADELREAGFDVIVINRASRGYDVTTVFWTDGQGPGGRAVAAALGTTEARVTPEEVRLSDSVDVHVVVGTDRS